MRILIAEDDATSRVMLDSVLRQWGFSTIVTCDGREALIALIEPDGPSLAVLDWNMPEMDGPEVCRCVRELRSQNPPYLILLSARDEKEDIVAGLDSGANDYISKPFNAAELRARVNVGRRMVEMQAELIKARDALAYQAAHDPLTEIFNRRAILDALDRELARTRRGNSWLRLGLFDLDHFKQINDVHGHQAGDEVLCGFVRTITEKIRKYDMFGRVGGEEFLLIAPESRDVGDDDFFRRLCRHVAETPIATSVGDVSITVSIGVAASRGETPVDVLIARADEALYRAKNNGRNCVVQYNDAQSADDL